jgi:hypothetical protein
MNFKMIYDSPAARSMSKSPQKARDFDKSLDKKLNRDLVSKSSISKEPTALKSKKVLTGSESKYTNTIFTSPTTKNRHKLYSSIYG